MGEKKLLSFSPLFEIAATVGARTPQVPSSPKNFIGASNRVPGQLSPQDVGKIIENNKKGPNVKAVVNLNPGSVSDLTKQSANSSSNAASRYGQQSAGAGQRQSSLMNGYVTKPTRTPGRVNTNPTFSARGI